MLHYQRRKKGSNRGKRGIGYLTDSCSDSYIYSIKPKKDMEQKRGFMPTCDLT